MRLVLISTFALLAACTPTGGEPDGGGGGTQCPTPSGSGTTHSGSVSADTTWAAADSPHVITSAISVAKAATLTIEPCAEVRIKATGITVDGKLVARGTSTKPITITADDATPFSYVRSFGSMDFENVTLKNGGATNDPNGLGVIDARGDSSLPPQALLRMVNVTIDGSQQWGVSLREGALFTTDSSGLTIKNAAMGAVRAEAPLAGSVPSGTYTGNGHDEITVIANVPIDHDSIWKARGVAYRIGDRSGNGNDMRVGSPYVPASLATLTIESGVVVAVSPGGRILLNYNSNGTTGALNATGATFTSAAASPAAGDWVGLYFGSVPASTTRLDNVRVEYAGGPSFARSYHCDLTGGLNEAEDAAIIILAEPSSAFVTNSTIVSSAGYGIDRGWSGSQLDFMATNTFQAVAKCKQSYPRSSTGSCPATVPCP
jgi:hypothetical protein